MMSEDETVLEQQIKIVNGSVVRFFKDRKDDELNRNVNDFNDLFTHDHVKRAGTFANTFDLIKGDPIVYSIFSLENPELFKRGDLVMMSYNYSVDSLTVLKDKDKNDELMFEMSRWTYMRTQAKVDQMIPLNTCVCSEGIIINDWVNQDNRTFIDVLVGLNKKTSMIHHFMVIQANTKNLCDDELRISRLS